jgi:hypothetical protein
MIQLRAKDQVQLAPGTGEAPPEHLHVAVRQSYSKIEENEESLINLNRLFPFSTYGRTHYLLVPARLFLLSSLIQQKGGATKGICPTNVKSLFEQ